MQRKPFVLNERAPFTATVTAGTRRARAKFISYSDVSVVSGKIGVWVAFADLHLFIFARFLGVQKHGKCPWLSRIVDKGRASSRITIRAEVAELADALRSGRSELNAHVGSNPTFGTRSPLEGLFFG